jgi:hypothetical protein
MGRCIPDNFITQVVVAAGFEADTGQTVDHFRVIIDIHEEHEPVFPDLNGMGGPVNLGQLFIELFKLPHDSDHAGVAAAKHKMILERDPLNFFSRHDYHPLCIQFPGCWQTPGGSLAASGHCGHPSASAEQLPGGSRRMPGMS